MITKKYRLLGPDGTTHESSTPGELGGNSKDKIYGMLTCSAANAALSKGYATHRVFFANEAVAIAAAFRPCGRCMRDQYSKWKAGGAPGTKEYPWIRLPK